MHKVDSVYSPDASVQFRLLLRESHLRYVVARGNQPVIEESSIKIILDGINLTEGVEVGEVKPYQMNETYPWRGVHSQAVNHCNGATISLKHTGSDTSYTLEIRAFDDGVAFRYLIPGDEKPRVPDEDTTFVIPTGSTVWYHDFHGHYEGVHEKRNIADIQNGDWAAPPLTFKLPNDYGYASITEAALVNYSGMALQSDGKRGFSVVLGHKEPVSYPFELRYSKEDIKRLAKPAAVTGEIVSPWRVVMIGADLNALVNCDIIHNLCPPPYRTLFPDGINTDWIRPGRAVWRYLDGGDRSFSGMKEFCRLAGELGFEHHVIEGFWREWSDAELQELVDYGRQHGVGIWLWKHCKELRNPEARRAFFTKCHNFGIAGVKLDFFDHEAKEIIDLYQTLLRETAENKLMVNFHGSNKPTGEPRTWPNEMTREAVKGMEYSKFLTRAQHDTTLPFTRLLAGHADYTPVHFGKRRGDTSWAHQIASAAILLSPLLTYAAHPQKILENPGVEMMKSIPSVWDETIVLPVSEIGEVAAFARRSGGTWFLAVMNGTVARSLDISLSFLDKGEYKAMIIRDSNDDPAAVEIESTVLKHSDSLTIELIYGGGFIARFSRK